MVSPALTNGYGTFALDVGSAKIQHEVFDGHTDGIQCDQHPSDH